MVEMRAVCVTLCQKICSFFTGSTVSFQCKAGSVCKNLANCLSVCKRKERFLW